MDQSHIFDLLTDACAGEIERYALRFCDPGEDLAEAINDATDQIASYVLDLVGEDASDAEALTVARQFFARQFAPPAPPSDEERAQIKDLIERLRARTTHR